MRDSKAPREDAYHQMHDVWAPSRLDCWAVHYCSSSASWSIIHSQYLTHVPPLQRSKRAESADSGQEHLLCTWCLCVPHHLKALAVWRHCVLYVGNFVTNHFPVTFWSLWQVGQVTIFRIGTGSVWHIMFTVGRLTCLQVSQYRLCDWNLSCYPVYVSI